METNLCGDGWGSIGSSAGMAGVEVKQGTGVKSVEWVQFLSSCTPLIQNIYAMGCEAKARLRVFVSQCIVQVSLIWVRIRVVNFPEM